MDIIVKDFENKKEVSLTDFIRSFCVDSAKESSLFCWVLIPQYTTPTLKNGCVGGRLFERGVYFEVW